MEECLSVHFAHSGLSVFFLFFFIIACWMLGVVIFPPIAYALKDLDTQKPLDYL